MDTGCPPIVPEYVPGMASLETVISTHVLFVGLVDVEGTSGSSTGPVGPPIHDGDGILTVSIVKHSTLTGMFGGVPHGTFVPAGRIRSTVSPLAATMVPGCGDATTDGEGDGDGSGEGEAETDGDGLGRGFGVSSTHDFSVPRIPMRAPIADALISFWV
jgi:hypothetical protein